MLSYRITLKTLWLGGALVRALDLRLKIAGSIPAAALSSATVKLFTHTKQYNLVPAYRGVYRHTVISRNLRDHDPVHDLADYAGAWLRGHRIGGQRWVKCSGAT